MDVSVNVETKVDIVLKTVEHSIPLDVLDDLCSRFIINVPESSKKDLVRICFQIELAHWFYLDFYCTDENAKLKSCGMQEFATHVFQHVPSLQQYADNLSEILVEWREYKQSVPTYGAILLSSDLTHVLLVQSYWAKNSWGFPKGKINEDEDPAHCAVREVLEETGFDISKLIDPNEYIESVINDQIVRLYIITGIDRKTTFQPRTRYEIKCCEWFAVEALPSNKKDCTPKVKIGVSPNAFFMVLPFVKRIKRWIQEKNRYSSQGRRNKNKSVCESDNKKGGNLKNLDDRNKMKSPLRSSNKKDSKKPSFKRQLFNSNNNSSSNNNENKFEYCAPSWLNFKFDRKALLNCLTNQ